MRRSQHLYTVVVSLVLCGVLLMWGSAAWAAERGNDANGKKLYLTYCFTCHGREGKGDGYAASVQPVKPRDLTNNAVLSTRTDEQLFQAISEGSSHFRGPMVMPAWWQSLTEQQLWDLVAYVRTLHQKHPAGDASRGTALYDSYCWTCHGKAGKGDGPIAVTFKPRPRDLTDRAYLSKRTDRDLYNVISQGGAAVERSPAMPAWGGVLSPQEIWDLVAYVRQFSKQP
jgi:cbb3-type cytochrome c oxidase subunit III